MDNETAMTPAQACERVRLEFGEAIQQLATLAQHNAGVALEMYAHLEAALEARVFRLCQASAAQGVKRGRLLERQAMMQRAGGELRVGVKRLPGARVAALEALR
jgi:hypothetical protein